MGLKMVQSGPREPLPERVLRLEVAFDAFEEQLDAIVKAHERVETLLRAATKWLLVTSFGVVGTLLAELARTALK